MENEIWKDINFESWGEFYQVSNLGRVRSKDRLESRINTKTNNSYQIKRKGKILVICKEKFGYCKVSLSYKASMKTMKVHRLMAYSFLGLPIGDKIFVNHIDGDKYNNDIDNLEWVTHQENIIHAHNIELMKHPQGKECQFSKKLIQIDATTDEIVNTWECSRDVYRTLGYNHSFIRSVCCGRRKTAYGFKWKYI
jgi:ribosomal protein L36